jgi:PncC family amidohydrolase
MMKSSNDKIEIIMKLMVRQGRKLGFAESCTGGLLSAAFVSQSGASQYFMGSVVSYDRKVKQMILHVPMALMQTLGEVSLPVAREMANGTRKCLNVDWALSITGVAGPSGGTKEKPVGMVCFGLVGPAVATTEVQYFGQQSRAKIQELSVQHAIDLLYKHLCGQA